MNELMGIIRNLPPVIVRGILVGLLTSVSAALLGVTLVLKRYSMIGDGLSHVAFGAMSLALVLNFAPLMFSVPVVVASSILLITITRKSTLGGDSSIALVSSTGLSIGIAAVSLAGGVNTGVSDYMFGSIVAISKEDAYICVPILIFVILIFVLLYNRIFAVTFDESFSKASGMKCEFYTTIIAVLTSLTVVIGMRIMGTLLISGLIIFPALSAMRICHSYRRVVILAAVVSFCCFILGTLSSILLDTPVGASIVIVNAVLFCIFSLLGKFVRV